LLQWQFTQLPWCCGKKSISSLQSHGKALEKKCCLPGVFCDSGDTPANLLCELNGHLMPCSSCFYGKWVENVCAGQFGVFVYLIIIIYTPTIAFSALILLVGRQEGHPACKKTEWWVVGVVVCLERGADLHTAQRMPLPLTVSCSSKIQIGFYLSGSGSPA